MTAFPRWRGRRVLVASAVALASQAALASGISIPANASIDSGAGTAVGLGCGDLSVAGTYTQRGDAGLGNMGQLALPGGTFNAGAGVVAVSGRFDTGSGTFNAGESTVSMGPAGADCAASAGGNQGQIVGAPSFYNWQVAGAGYAVSLPVAQKVTVTNGLTLENAHLLATAGSNTRAATSTKAGTLEPVKDADSTQAWLAYTGAATPAIRNIGVNGVQSVGGWLAADQTNQIAGGTAINWFARATVTDPDPGGSDPGGGNSGNNPGGGTGGGSTTASAQPVPTLGAGGLLALSAALGGLAAWRRRSSSRRS